MNYYDKINWKNRSEGKTTKISAERLNHMDNQIFNNANAIGNVEKIADIGDGTLCGAAETLKETAEKLTQSLNDKANIVIDTIGDGRKVIKILDNNGQHGINIILSTEYIRFDYVLDGSSHTIMKYYINGTSS